MDPAPTIPPHWEQDLATAVGRLAAAVQHYRSTMRRDRYGMDSRGGMALGVLHASGPLTPGQLSGLINLTPPATTELLDRLDRAGYISRRPHPTDRRKVLVATTAAADDLAAREWSDFAQLIGDALRDNDQHLRDQVIQAIGAVVRTVERAMPAPGPS
ncbi:MAG TPA: MarR family transcriptional regulator [Pseudonocardia sp.]|jgi:DNA-binding MarR family transcriptional regulator